MCTLKFNRTKKLLGERAVLCGDVKSSQDKFVVKLVSATGITFTLITKHIDIFLGIDGRGITCPNYHFLFIFTGEK